MTILKTAISPTRLLSIATAAHVFEYRPKLRGVISRGTLLIRSAGPVNIDPGRGVTNPDRQADDAVGKMHPGVGYNNSSRAVLVRFVDVHDLCVIVMVAFVVLRASDIHPRRDSYSSFCGCLNW